MTMTTFGSRLRAARKLCGLNQVQLAQTVNLDVRTISAYERGKNTPKLSTLFSLSDVLKCSPAWLLGEKQYP